MIEFFLIHNWIFFNSQLNFFYDKNTKILKCKIGTLISYFILYLKLWDFKNALWNLNFNVEIQYAIITTF